MKLTIYTALAVGLNLLLGGCSIRPAVIGPRVQGVREAQTAANAQATLIESGKASSALTSAEITKLKTLAQRADGKASVVLQWLNRQERKKHQTAP